MKLPSAVVAHLEKLSRESANSGLCAVHRVRLRVRALRDAGNLVLALREVAKARLLLPGDEEVERPAPGQVAAAASGAVIANMRRMMAGRHSLSARDQEAVEHIAKRCQGSGDHGTGLLLRVAASLRDLAFAERDYAQAFHYNTALLAMADTGGNRLVQARIMWRLAAPGFNTVIICGRWRAGGSFCARWRVTSRP